MLRGEVQYFMETCVGYSRSSIPDSGPCWTAQAYPSLGRPLSRNETTRLDGWMDSASTGVIICALWDTLHEAVSPFHAVGEKDLPVPIHRCPHLTALLYDLRNRGVLHVRGMSCVDIFCGGASKGEGV